MGTAIKHPVPDRVKLSFVIIDIQALWRSALSVKVGVSRRQPHRRSSLATLPSVGAVP